MVECGWEAMLSLDFYSVMYLHLLRIKSNTLLTYGINKDSRHSPCKN